MNAFLGGVEIVIGSAEYIINKRAISNDVNNEPYELYYNTDFIYPNDIVESVLKSIKDNKPIYIAVHKLANTLNNRDNMLFDKVKAIPSLTGSELKEFIDNNFYDNEEIIKINNKLKNLAYILKLDIPIEDVKRLEIPDLPPKSRYNDRGIMQMEEKMKDYICLLERNQGILAFNCQTIANELLDEPYEKVNIFNSIKETQSINPIDITNYLSKKDNYIKENYNNRDIDRRSFKKSEDTMRKYSNININEYIL
jgi:hypothetical protein